MEYLSQLVLEGRQAGVFIIFAMQRPDGEFIKAALRRPALETPLSWPLSQQVTT